MDGLFPMEEDLETSSTFQGKLDVDTSPTPAKQWTTFFANSWTTSTSSTFATAELPELPHHTNGVFYNPTTDHHPTQPTVININNSSELSSVSTAAVKNVGTYDKHELGSIVPMPVENGCHYATHHIGSPLVVSQHGHHHMNGAFKFLLPPPMIGSPAAMFNHQQPKNGYLHHQEDSPPRISVLMTINVQD